MTGSKGVLGDSVTIRADDDAYRLYRCADATTRLGTREPRCGRGLVGGAMALILAETVFTFTSYFSV